MALAAVLGAVHPTCARAETDGMQLAECLTAASATHEVPLSVLLILLQVEGGSLGRVSQNNNATVDIGPMQINSIWVPKVAAHWHSNLQATYVALRDNFCANVEAGAWILQQSLQEAHGDFWNGVGLYHSHDPGYKADYLHKVLKAALRLQSAAHRTGDAASTIAVARN